MKFLVSNENKILSRVKKTQELIQTLRGQRDFSAVVILTIYGLQLIEVHFQLLQVVLSW